MNKKSLILCSATALLGVSALSGCAALQNSNTIVVWVGSESVEYYRDLSKQFLNEHLGFDYKISIVGADTGSAGGQMVADNGACGDIVTIAHDNIGKLSQASYIAPIVDSGTEGKALLDQIKADNPEGFQKAIKNILGNDTTHTYTFAAPYISQALFLYYDTRYVTDKEADTFEGLKAAAARYDDEHKVTGTKSYTVTGTDGFNYSFSLLARNVTNGQNTSDLRLYENGVKDDAYVQTNQEVAVMKWMQRSYADTNGILLESDSPWSTNIQQHKALSVIGGAWHYESFKKAVTDANGKVNMGCKIIPTFELAAEDVAGIEEVKYPADDTGLPEELRGKTDPAPVKGTLMRGGSFVDCKCFVINMAKMTGAEKYYKMCTLIKYFSTKQAQNESFVQCLNVPAYAGAEDFIEQAKDKVEETAYLMARSQTGMSTYGIPQPFSSGTLNTFYYSMQAPDHYVQCVKKSKDSSGKQIGADVEGIREALFKMEYIWKHGTTPGASVMPTSFPAETTSRRK